MNTSIQQIDDHLPPSDDVRAGEYVLGVLDSQARLQAQSRMATDPSFAGLVDQWEQRFAAWMTRAETITPSAHVWPRIRSELGWTAVASTPTGLWNSVGFWRGATALAAAASVAVIVFGLRGPTPTTTPQQVVVQQQPPPQLPPQT